MIAFSSSQALTYCDLYGWCPLESHKAEPEGCLGMLWGTKPGRLGGGKGRCRWSGIAFAVRVCWVPVSDPLAELGTLSPSPSAP